jgi:hypothetical protein
MMFTLSAAVIVSVFLTWSHPDTNEDGAAVFREIAGTYQQVGAVGPEVTQFSESFSAVGGSEQCYIVKTMYGGQFAPDSNEWCGQVPLDPEPCVQKGKSKNCR